MSKEAMEKKFCKETNSKMKINVLGYLEADPDTQTEKTNEFIVFKKNEGNKSEVLIRSNWLTGTSMTEDKFIKLAQKTKSEGKQFAAWGSPFNPSAGDNRRTEYRFYQENGNPKSIEIFTVARDSEGKALPPKSLKIDWA